MIATARALKPARICVVYGHGGEQVPQALRRGRSHFVRQEPQLGTGHALQQALPHLERRGRTLVLYGDVPLVGAETLAAMIAGGARRPDAAHRGARRPDRLRAHRAQPRGSDHRASSRRRTRARAQRRIREVNTGIMALPGARLAALAVEAYRTTTRSASTT